MMSSAVLLVSLLVVFAAPLFRDEICFAIFAVIVAILVALFYAEAALISVVV